nr:DUF1232 domain-containing protein [uncultured Desulfobacter sp.]
MEQKRYEKFFSESTFWGKIKNLPTTAPFCILLRTAVSLYVLLKESNTPIATKSIIVFSLGYFICPLDCLPDFVPFGIGFSDDLALMAAVLASVYSYLSEDIQEKVQDILPEICKGEIKLNPAANADPEIQKKTKRILKRKKETIL